MEGLEDVCTLWVGATHHPHAESTSNLSRNPYSQEI